MSCEDTELIWQFDKWWTVYAFTANVRYFRFIELMCANQYPCAKISGKYPYRSEL